MSPTVQEMEDECGIKMFQKILTGALLFIGPKSLLSALALDLGVKKLRKIILFIETMLKNEVVISKS